MHNVSVCLSVCVCVCVCVCLKKAKQRAETDPWAFKHLLFSSLGK
jgi:hypothetical protein